MDLSDGGDQNYKAIKWDEKMTEARRTLDWEKQINLSIDPENARKVHYRHDEQHQGNNVPCTMCGSACVYIMLPQQRKYEKITATAATTNSTTTKNNEPA